MHLFCSRCKNRPSLHISEETNRAKQYLIQRSFKNNLTVVTLIWLPKQPQNENITLHTTTEERRMFSQQNHHFVTKVTFSPLFMHTLIQAVGRRRALTRRFNHAAISLYHPSPLEHASRSICPDCTWCCLFVRFPQVLPRTPLNNTGLS